MTSRHLHAPVLAALCAVGFATNALATITTSSPAPVGAIVRPSSPSDPAAAPSADAVAPATATVQPGQMVVPEKPLLVIRFNQKRVYFERALRQAVASAEQTRAGVVYHVVLFLPPSQDNHQSPRISQESMGYQQTVINELQKQGIPPSRIRTSTGYDGVQSPEVRLFVN